MFRIEMPRHKVPRLGLFDGLDLIDELFVLHSLVPFLPSRGLRGEPYELGGAGQARALIW
jgi:hypothetical protein